MLGRDRQGIRAPLSVCGDREVDLRPAQRDARPIVIDDRQEMKACGPASFFYALRFLLRPTNMYLPNRAEHQTVEKYCSNSPAMI